MISLLTLAGIGLLAFGIIGFVIGLVGCKYSRGIDIAKWYADFSMLSLGIGFVGAIDLVTVGIVKLCTL